MFVILVCSSLLARAQEIKSVAGTPSAKDSKKQSYGFDIGLSGNLLLSDQSLDTTGLGIGSQYSFYFHFNKDQKWNLKARIERVQSQQEIVTESNIRSMGDTRLKRLKQAWWLVGVSNERNLNTHWNWEWGGGWAQGEKTDSLTITDGANPEPDDFNLTTNSFMYMNLGFILRYPYKGKTTLTARLGTYALLNPLYKGEFKNKSLVLLPVLASIGFEL